MMHRNIILNLDFTRIKLLLFGTVRITVKIKKSIIMRVTRLNGPRRGKTLGNLPSKGNNEGVLYVILKHG
jgi:hypothetical protein